MKENNILYDLETFKKTKIEDISLDDVIDIESIKLSRKKSSDERILDFLNLYKNPYFYKVDGKIVKIEFSDSNLTAEQCITRVLKDLYK